jgi:hypothetical protein
MSDQKTAATVTIAGQEQPLGTLGLREIGELSHLAKLETENPLESIKGLLGILDGPGQRQVTDAALADLRRPVLFGSPEFFSFVQSGSGFRAVTFMALKRGGANVSREDSDAAADAMSVTDAAEVIAVAFGRQL